MLRIGKIIRKNADSAVVKVPRVGGTCETCVCEAGGGDPSCVSDNSFFVTAANPGNFPVGSRVEVDIKRGKILSTVLVVFWIPLLIAGLFGYGAWFAAENWLGRFADLLAALGSLAGLVLGALLVLQVERRTVGSRRGVTITRLLTPPATATAAPEQSVMEKLADPESP